jgi:hypothetical protein
MKRNMKRIEIDVVEFIMVSSLMSSMSIAAAAKEQ